MATTIYSPKVGLIRDFLVKNPGRSFTYQQLNDLVFDESVSSDYVGQLVAKATQSIVQDKLGIVTKSRIGPSDPMTVRFEPVNVTIVTKKPRWT